MLGLAQADQALDPKRVHIASNQQLAAMHVQHDRAACGGRRGGRRPHEHERAARAVGPQQPLLVPCG